MITAGMRRVGERFLTSGCSKVLSQLYVLGIDTEHDEWFNTNMLSMRMRVVRA